MKKKKFEEYVNNLNLKQVHTGSIWTEGPCYLKKLNKVVLSSNQTLIWDTLNAIGYKNNIEGFGKLLKMK